MRIGQKIDVIKKICQALDQSEILNSNLILKQFGSQTWTDFPESNYEYYLQRVQNLDDKPIIEMYEYLYPGEPLPSGLIPHSATLWKDGFVKIFISHSSKQKLLATQIKNEAGGYGIDCFVAHEDIEPTKDWLREIRYGLASCDCIVALLTKDFRESFYCDQEIGFALQRGILIIPISLEVDPYGFIAPFQRVTAFQKTPTEIVEEIRALIEGHESLAETARKGIIASQKELIISFLASSNFGDSTTLLKKIEDLPTIPESHLKQLHEGWEKNDQIFGCRGIPARMGRLFRKHGFKESGF